MKNILLITAIVLTLFSCGNKVDNSLEGKKKALKAIATQMADLQLESDSLHAQINKLEGVKVIKRTLITTYKVSEKPFDAFVEVQGTSQAENSVNITTDIGGLVKAVYVDEGQYVTRGKTLIRLDNAIALSQMAEIESAMTLAKDVFEKRKRLWDKNIGSEVEFLQAKNNYDGLLKKKATLGVQLRKSNIKAPISGKVDMVFLKVGELASPGMPAVNVVNLKNMEVQVAIPESYLGAIKKGSKVMVEFPTINKTVEARVKSVSQSINRNNRTFTAVASIQNRDGLLKPNLLAKIKIKSVSLKNAITIPSKLLQKSSKGYFVYVVNEMDTNIVAKEISVEIGSSYNGEIVITNGLKADDVLINEGFRDVLDGDLLKIAE